MQVRVLPGLPTSRNVLTNPIEYGMMYIMRMKESTNE